MLIYVPRVTARVSYIFSLVVHDLIGTDVEFTVDIDDFSGFSGPKLAYAPDYTGPAPFIEAVPLLFSDRIDQQEIVMMEYQDHPAFFGISSDRSLLPFDLFAASFYLVSRYEEYLPFHSDKHGRFPAEQSISCKKNFLHLPVVNIWAEMLKGFIKKIYPEISFREKKFRITPTIDIDHAYAYLSRPVYRTMGGYARSLQRADFREVLQRTAVLLRLEKDPYDCYSVIKRIHSDLGLKPCYFVLYANYGGDDNNVSLESRRLRMLIRELDKTGTVGIHPSLASSKKSVRLSREIQGLSEVLGRKILISRQHFLRVSFPDTYRTLVDEGITDDYSLGYASKPGFRAGTADPFCFFDLEKNEATPLVIHPVVLMDVTLKDYLRLSTNEAAGQCRKMIDEIRKVNGEFIPLWHNESFSENRKWKGWTRVYMGILRYASGIMKEE